MPQVGVHALILNDENQILLVRKNYLEKDWGAPGGLMEEGESIPSAVAREVKEETGLNIETLGLAAVVSRAKTNDVIIVIKAKVAGDSSFKVDDTEISDIGFFSPVSLPKPMKPEVRKLIQLVLDDSLPKLWVVD